MATEPVIRDEPRTEPVQAAPRRVRSRLDPPLVLYGVLYEMYVRVRDDPRNERYRMTYYDGTLEIMSPQMRHERPADQIGVLIRAVGTILKIPLLGTRSTTFRRGQVGLPRGKGKEPDHSFYFTHLDEVAAKGNIDLDVDPPPDLWIEVDNRGSSKGRLPLYAELGVPEVWRYRVRDGRLWFGRLEGAAYTEIDRSLALPMLTPELIMFALGKCGSNESSWDEWLRVWVAARMPTDAP